MVKPVAGAEQDAQLMEPAHVLRQAIEQVATQVEHFQRIGEPEDLTRKLRQPSVQPQLSRTGQITPPQRLEICAHDRVLESWVGDHLFRNAAMRCACRRPAGRR